MSEQIGEGALVTLDHLTRRHSKSFSLQVSAEITPGVTMLVGLNGAGKSTLMRLLATVDTPDSGTYRFAGEPLDSPAALDRARRQIGWLPQVFGYEPSSRVTDYLRYLGWLRGLTGARLVQACDEALERLSLTQHAGQRLGALSGGMLRRVGVAQAVVAKPRLLLLDEPSGGLDPVQREQLHDVIRDLGTSTAVVCATHLLEDLDQVADRVLVLVAGGLGETYDYPDLVRTLGADRARRTVLDAIRGDGDTAAGATVERP